MNSHTKVEGRTKVDGCAKVDGLEQILAVLFVKVEKSCYKAV